MLVFDLSWTFVISIAFVGELCCSQSRRPAELFLTWIFFLFPLTNLTFNSFFFDFLSSQKSIDLPQESPSAKESPIDTVPTFKRDQRCLSMQLLLWPLSHLHVSPSMKTFYQAQTKEIGPTTLECSPPRTESFSQKLVWSIF